MAAIIRQQRDLTVFAVRTSGFENIDDCLRNLLLLLFLLFISGQGGFCSSMVSLQMVRLIVGRNVFKPSEPRRCHRAAPGTRRNISIDASTLQASKQ